MLEWISFIGWSFLGFSPQTLSRISHPLAVEKFKALDIMSVGVIVDSQRVLSSISVRGLDDGTQAVYFRQWLIPFDQVVQIFGLNVSYLENGQLELRSLGWVTQVHPEKLKVDAKLGLVLSIEEIETLFHVPAQFDMAQHAIVFNLPGSQRSSPQENPQITPLSVVPTGLPEIRPAPLSFTALQQQTHISQDEEDLSVQGNVMGIGTIGPGSWYIRTDQADLLQPKHWQLEEAQFFWKEEKFDVAIGSQPTFWQSRHTEDYWGTTFIKRSGFRSLLPSSGGFEPSERRQTDQVTKTILGEAEPGTLVRLTEGLGDQVIAEVLVDSSGIYRFEKILMTPQENREYHVLLYPHGTLTAEPEIRQAYAVTRVDQLGVGDSALIFSLGGIRKSTDHFFGELDDFQGGIGYRWGVTESLTLGGGVVSHEKLHPLVELFYQPLVGDLPFALGITALREEDDILYNAEMTVQFSKKLAFYFNSDPLSKRFQWTWNLLPELSVSTRGESRTDRLSTGLTFSKHRKNFGGVFNAEIDNKQRVRWNLTGYLNNYKVKQIGNDVNTSTRLSYHFSGQSRSESGHSLFLHRESKDIKSQHDQLHRFGWHYQSPKKSWEGKELWELEAGYSRGSYGRGMFATLSTGIFSGIALQFRYQGISIASDSASFFLEVVSNFKLHPQLDQGNGDFETLRGEGGLFVRPFIDKNNNGVQDLGEKIYTDQVTSLLTLNHQALEDSQIQVTAYGMYIQLPVGTYRLDLNPTVLVHGSAAHSSYAVKVIAGGYSSISIPLTFPDPLTGTVQDRQGSPVRESQVESAQPGSLEVHPKSTQKVILRKR